MLSRESHGIQMWTSETAQRCCAWDQDSTKNYIPHNCCAVTLVIQVTGAGAFDAGFASSDGFAATWAKRNVLDKLRNLALKWGSRVPGELFSYLWTMLGTKKSSGPHTSPLPNTIKQSVHWVGSSLPNPMEMCLYVCQTILSWAASSRYWCYSYLISLTMS